MIDINKNKKKARLLGYSLSIAGLIILLSLSYLSWLQINSAIVEKQRIMSKLSANSADMVIHKYESVLNTLGTHFVTEHSHLNTQHIRENMDQALALNPSIAAISLHKLSGLEIISSSNFDLCKSCEKFQIPTQSINGLSHEKTALLLGRVYFDLHLKQLVIPFSTYIRNRSGEPIFIINALIKENVGFSFIHELSATDDSMLVWLFRPSDSYAQLIPLSATKDAKLYQRKVPKSNIDEIQSILEKKYAQNFEQLTRGDQVYNYINIRYLDNKKVIASIQYLPRYNLWLVTQTLFQVALDKFAFSFIGLLALYLFFVAGVFALYRCIINIDNRNQKKFRDTINSDPLTKLHNKYYLIENEARILSHPGDNLHYLLLDFANFKAINESYSYKIGDDTLIEIANRLQFLCLNEDDVIIHYSGSEFIIICRLSDNTDIQSYTKNLIDWLCKTYKIQNQHLILDLNIGIAQYPKDAKNLHNLRSCARFALSSAKENRNSYRLFCADAMSIQQRDFQIRQALKTALQFHEISVVYQPQSDNTGKISGVEALARWHNAKLGNIAPLNFIQIAEQTGYMYEIGQFVLSQSIEDLKKLQDKFQQPLRLAVNISLKQMSHPNFYQDITSLLDKFSYTPSLLTLEITENIFKTDMSGLQQNIKELKSYGIKISLDNFDISYASLSALRELSIDEIKLNKNIVQQTSADHPLNDLLDNVISIAQDMACVVVGQGVETLQQHKQLINNGCNILQGYFIARTLTKIQLAELVRERKPLISTADLVEMNR